jgi:hypothetical protein
LASSPIRWFEVIHFLKIWFAESTEIPVTHLCRPVSIPVSIFFQQVIRMEGIGCKSGLTGAIGREVPLLIIVRTYIAFYNLNHPASAGRGLLTLIGQESSVVFCMCSLMQRSNS